MKRLIKYTNDGEPYFTVYKRQWFLSDIDNKTGLNLTLFTNWGYYGGYKLVDVEHGIEDYAILQKVTL